MEILDDYYRPFELTVLQDLFAFSEINHSVRDYMMSSMLAAMGKMTLTRDIDSNIALFRPVSSCPR